MRRNRRRDRRGDGVGIGLGIATAQCLEGLRHRVGHGLQAFDVGARGRRRVRRGQPLDAGLEPVRHLAQAHGAGEAGAALERVQRAHAGGGVRRRRRLAEPVAQLAVEAGQQVLRLFLEDREQLEVDGVDRIDLVVDVAEGRGARRDRPRRLVGRGGQRLQLGHAEGGHRAEAAEHRRRRLRSLLALDGGFGRRHRLRLDRLVDRRDVSGIRRRRRLDRRRLGAIATSGSTTAASGSTSAASGSVAVSATWAASPTSSFGACAVSTVASGAAPVGTVSVAGASGVDDGAAASDIGSSESSGSTAMPRSAGDSLSWPSASSEAAVTASRRRAELSSCSARRTSRSGTGCCRKPAANWCSRRRISSAA